MIGVLLTIPFIASIVAYVWTFIFNMDDRFPGGPKMHLILTLSQLLIVTCFYLNTSSLVALYLIGLLYFGQAIGVSYFLVKKGKVDCGCFGSQNNSKLSWKLAFFNVFFGLLAILTVNFEISILIELSIMEGLLTQLIITLLVTYIVIGYPDALYAYKAYKVRAGRYKKFVLKGD